MDGCKETCQRQTEMEKARRPMFQQELEELRSKVAVVAMVVHSQEVMPAQYVNATGCDFALAHLAC